MLNAAFAESLLLPCTANEYLPGSVLRATPAIAYHQLHVWAKRNDSLCPSHGPSREVSSTGVMTRNSTGEPLTSCAGSHLTFRGAMAWALPGRKATAKRVAIRKEVSPIGRRNTSRKSRYLMPISVI